MLQFEMVLLDGAKVGILCQNRQQNSFFQISQRGGNAPVHNFARPQYFRQGVDVPKDGKNTHKLFCTKPSNFPHFGGPYLQIGGRHPHAFTAV